MLLFKKGKSIEAHYDDSLVLNKICDIPLLTDKMVTVFGHNILIKNIGILVNQNYKVALVHKTSSNFEGNETDYDSQHQRTQEDKWEISKVFTKTTFVDEEEVNYQSRYLWSIYSFTREEIDRAKQDKDAEIELFESSAPHKDELEPSFIALSFTIAEMSIGKVTTGLLIGNLESKISNLMHQFPPTEVIFDSKRVSKSILNSLKNSIWQPNMYKQSSVKKKNMWSTV